MIQEDALNALSRTLIDFGIIIPKSNMTCSNCRHSIKRSKRTYNCTYHAGNRIELLNTKTGVIIEKQVELIVNKKHYCKNYGVKIKD